MLLRFWFTACESDCLMPVRSSQFIPCVASGIYSLPQNSQHEWRLSRRLAWRLAAVMAIAMILAAAAVVWRTLATIGSLDDAALQSQARLVASLVSVGPDGKPRLDLSGPLAAAFRDSDSSSFFVVYDPTGAVAFSSNALAPAAIAPYAPPSWHGFFRAPRSGLFPDGLLGVQEHQGPWRVVVAQAHEQQEGLVESLLREFLFSALWLLVPMALLVVGIAVLTLRHGLRPLRQASAAAAQIGPEHPHVRLPIIGLPGRTVAVGWCRQCSARPDGRLARGPPPFRR